MAFAITPVEAPLAQAQAGEFIQFQNDGTALGAPNVTVVNFTGTGIEATRGTGENANVITVRITPPPVNFDDQFEGFAEALYLHTPDVAPASFAWSDNSPNPNLLLDGSGSLMNPGVDIVGGTGTIAMPMSTNYSLLLYATMDGAGVTDSVSGVSFTLTDFDSGYSVKLIVQRVFGGTYNVTLQGAVGGQALDVGAGGAHIFEVAVYPGGVDVRLDGDLLFTALGSTNVATVNNIALDITNTDAGRNHTLQRFTVIQG